MDEMTTLISVRGEARVTVPPDFGVLKGVLTTIRDSKAQALEVAAAELQRLTADLRSLGGVPLTAETQKPPLAWASYAAGTQPEHEVDKQAGRYGPTGRVVASVSISVLVRTFDLLDRLNGMLAAHEGFNVHYVSWGVDPDHAVWPEVRAAAIQDALNKGRHYAEALGGSLIHVEHLADAGLLGGEPESFRRSVDLSGGRAAADTPDSPSLDPVPQELIAIIDARLLATVAAL